MHWLLDAHLYEKLKRRRHKNKVRRIKLDEVMLHADVSGNYRMHFKKVLDQTFTLVI